MDEPSRTDSHDATTAPRGRGGRPPASQAGDVDARILDAASTLFLRQGFEATSCDQVALLARAGKASIYARHANKEALLAAVVRRDAARAVPPDPFEPTDRPVADRLLSVGTELVRQALDSQALALLRLVIGEAVRFPALAAHVNVVARDARLRRVAEAIAGPSASPDALERAQAPAALFIELALVPLQMRALLGEEPARLREEAGAQVAVAAALMAASKRIGGQ